MVERTSVNIRVVPPLLLYPPIFSHLSTIRRLPLLRLLFGMRGARHRPRRWPPGVRSVLVCCGSSCGNTLWNDAPRLEHGDEDAGRIVAPRRADLVRGHHTLHAGRYEGGSLPGEILVEFRI